MAELEDSLRPVVSRLRTVWERLKQVPDFGWARVTSVAPLKIRFELAGQDFTGTPSTLVSDLKVDDRVLCLVKRNRVTIVGRSRNDTVRRFANLPALNAWKPADGAIAYVTADNRQYVRISGQWQPVAVAGPQIDWTALSSDIDATVRAKRDSNIVSVKISTSKMTVTANTYLDVADIGTDFAPTGTLAVGNAYKAGGSNRFGQMRVNSGKVQVVFSEALTDVNVYGSVTYLI